MPLSVSTNDRIVRARANLEPVAVMVLYPHGYIVLLAAHLSITLVSDRLPIGICRESGSFSPLSHKPQKSFVACATICLKAPIVLFNLTVHAVGTAFPRVDTTAPSRAGAADTPAAR
jgi:hypothetical protein